jgi:CRISPR-associated protein Csx3
MVKPIFESTTVQDVGGTLFRSITFEIPGGVATPAQFAEAVEAIRSQLEGRLPVLLSGRGPVWGYGMLFHAAHPTPAIAVYDPRLGYVVVETHDERFHVGQIIEVAIGERRRRKTEDKQ